MDNRRRNPPGILLIRRISGKEWSLTTYRYVVLLVTFIAYTAYHASRKPSSIVKSVLYPDPNANNTNGFFRPWPAGDLFLKKEESLMMMMSSNSSSVVDGGDRYSKNRGWAPFNDEDGTSKLGEIDLAFLAFYSMGMYGAGHLGDTLDLRIFLTTGMVGSGIFVGLFGMGYFWNFHIFGFYLVMQMFAGLFQATGWPSVVAVIGNWFGKRKRGLIMGVWNAHTSVGNITGSLLAASVLEYGWGWCFILPGAFIFFSGIIVYLFLPAYPEDIGFGSENGQLDEVVTMAKDEEAQMPKELGNGQSCVTRGGSECRKSIGLLGACLIPGVIPFALCLFFAKMVAYTFLYWLPFYLSQNAIEGQYMSVRSAGNLSTLFDVGGIVGGVLAGYVSDKLKARATTAATFMYAAIPSMLLYRKYGSTSKVMNVVLMMTAGLFVNGPYALITTAVSADLGTHSSLSGDSRALATVTAIIDGTGSIGAALGPLLTGFLSTKGWNAVFWMLIVGAFSAGLLLSHLVVDEIKEKLSKCKMAGNNHADPVSQPLLSDEVR